MGRFLRTGGVWVRHANKFTQLWHQNPRPLLWLKILKLTLFGEKIHRASNLLLPGRTLHAQRQAWQTNGGPQLVNLAREFCQNNLISISQLRWATQNPHCFHFLVEKLCHFAMVSVCIHHLLLVPCIGEQWRKQNDSANISQELDGVRWVGWKFSWRNLYALENWVCKIIFLFNRAIFRFHIDFSGCTLRRLFFLSAGCRWWTNRRLGNAFVFRISTPKHLWWSFRNFVVNMEILIWSWRKNSLSFWNRSIIGSRWLVLVTSSSEVKNLEPQAVHCKCILEMTLSVWKMTILPLPLGTFLTCDLSKATSFSLVLFSLGNLAAMTKQSTTSNCVGSHYFPITQWIPSITRLCSTVAGSEIRLTNWGW